MWTRLLIHLALRMYPEDIRRQAGDELRPALALNLAHTRQVYPRTWGVVALAAIARDVRRAFRNRAFLTPRERDPWHPVRDVKFALRTMRKSPGLFGALVVVIALGVGANSAVFSLVQAVVLRSLPYEAPEQLTMVWTTVQDGRPSGVTPATLVRWRDAGASVFSGFASMATWQGNLDAMPDLIMPDRSERLRGALVSSNFFEVLGSHAAVGRVFTASDEARGDTAVVVLGHSLWSRVFGSDRSLVGKQIPLVSGFRQGRATRYVTVVGVLPEAFRFTYPVETDIWILEPWSAIQLAAQGRSISHTGAVARLKPGLSITQAESVVAQTDQGSDRARGIRTRLQPIADAVHLTARPYLYLLTGVAALVLIIVCSTVAGALLVRVAERQRELAVRRALGASRGRLLAQLLVEGLLLSLLGVGAGLLLAINLMPALRALVPAQVPRGDELGVDPMLFLYATAIIAIVTLLGSAAPAWRGSSQDVMTSLKRSASGVATDRTSARWRRALVGAQAALACALLVSATLLLISFWRLTHVPLGFETRNIVTFEMRLLDGRPAAAQRDFVRALTDRLKQVPGLTEVGVTSAVPFRGVDFAEGYRPAGTDGPGFLTNARYVDPGFFSVLGIPLLRGRLIDDSDGPGAPLVTVVSESFARRVFGDRDPLGLVIDDDADLPRGRTIVGVVADARFVSAEEAARPAVYRAVTQSATGLICVVARSAGPMSDAAAVLREAVHDVDPSVPIMNVSSLARIVEDATADRRFYAVATLVFAGLALVLTVAGLAVVVARTLVERQRELAIRATLGAGYRQLVSRVMGEGLVPVTAGAAIGLAAALAAAATLERFLFEVDARDPWVFGAVGVGVVAAAMLACYVPSRRAATVDPAALLRSE